VPPSSFVRNLLVGLLWLWLLVSLGVYGYRLWRRVAKRSGTDHDGATLGDEMRAAPIAPRAADTAPVVPSPPLAAPPAIPTPPPQPSPPPSRSRADDQGGRSGFFAPSTPSRPTPDATTARPVVADVLQGISLPCDLSPIVDTGRALDPYRVAFVTHRATPAEVGAGVGDELERLGFSLATVSDTELEATKDEGRVVVTLHPDPSTVTFGAAPAFPNLPEGSVVVEFHT
jgi:hypothetical protein